MTDITDMLGKPTPNVMFLCAQDAGWKSKDDIQKEVESNPPFSAEKGVFEPTKDMTAEEQSIIKNILYLKKFKGQEKSILSQLRYSNKQAVEKARKEWENPKHYLMWGCSLCGEATHGNVCHACGKKCDDKIVEKILYAHQAVESARKEWEKEDGSAVKDIVAMQKDWAEQKQKAYEQGVKDGSLVAVEEAMSDLRSCIKLNYPDDKTAGEIIETIDARWPKVKEKEGKE